MVALPRAFVFGRLFDAKSYYPDWAVTQSVWAVPASLATTTGITVLFSLPAGNEMFQFPAFALCYQSN